MRLGWLSALAASFCLPVCADLEAGAAARRITPRLDRPVYLAGFGNNRIATGVHDDLWARCLALRTAHEPVVVCAVDLIGLFHDDVKMVRDAVPGARVIVAATHTHQGPDTMGQWGPKPGVSGLDETYNAFVVAETAAAAREAVSRLTPVRMFPAAATPPDVAAYYDDTRPPVVHDPEILSLVFRDRRGRAVATLVNWNNHPEALGSRNTLITSDYVHYLRQALEEEGFGTVVFVNGALGGMQSPLGAKIMDPETGQPAPKDSFRFAEIVGRYAARHVIESQKKAKSAAVDTVLYRETMVHVPVTNANFLMAAKAGIFGGRKPMQDGGTAAPVGYLRISRGAAPVVEAALVPGELYPELSVGGAVCDPNADFPGAAVEKPLKKMLSAPFRMLFGLANDEIGYILPKCQWDEQPPFTFGATKRWYGEVNSTGPEAAARIAGAFESLLKP
ncbi:MAG: hypothetical protein NZR01_06095 [Bryobacteraceae bacterium]|nr:hypothetical protein [Bryobacteraceae bacterium]